jgi:hypothetical protein
MSADHERRIGRRRQIVADLRAEAEALEGDAAAMRARADRLEASTDELERAGS